MRTIILLNGFLGSGKNTLGEYIVNHLPEYHCYALSDAAKNLASKKYNFPREWADLRDEKDRKRDEFQGQSVRDLVRSIWVELDGVNPTQISEEITKNIQLWAHQKVIITDFRLERDFHYFVKAFGRQSVITVKIIRDCVQPPDRATHFEEYALENFTFDCTIQNNGTEMQMYEAFYRKVFHLTHKGGHNPNFYYVRTPPKFALEVKRLMDYYEFESEVVIYQPRAFRHSIERQKHHQVFPTFQHSIVADFILQEIFYSQPKNLHHFPISNSNSEVVHFKTSPYDLIATNPITQSLCKHPIYGNYLNLVSNYGTFIRLAENKVQRLYWNLPLNAGLPLTPKEKDPVAEMVFLLHDYGHFLLPDLVFTGEVSENGLTDLVYVCWRLLGESITIVLSEMLIVNELKSQAQFQSHLKTELDKPYKLYELMSSQSSFKNPEELKALFWASYQYFCQQNPEGFLKLANCDIDDPVWKEFNQRYLPISQRGKDWTQGNIRALKMDTHHYLKWWKLAQPFAKDLQLVTVTEIVSEIETLTNCQSELAIMEYLFGRAWDHVLKPLFEGIKIERIPDTRRQVLAFQRLMLGNLLLFVKLGRTDDPEVMKMIDSLKDISSEDIEKHRIMYRLLVGKLYQQKLITANEYVNSLNIYLMIAPNMLKKTDGKELYP